MATGKLLDLCVHISADLGQCLTSSRESLGKGQQLSDGAVTADIRSPSRVAAPMEAVPLGKSGTVSKP